MYVLSVSSLQEGIVALDVDERSLADRVSMCVCVCVC